VSTLQRAGPTPFHRLDRASARLGLDLWTKRDDLYPLSGGGNKARKMAALATSLPAAACEVVITTGGLQSNHARVVALTAAARGWECILVLHGSEEERARQADLGNLRLCELAGARIVVVAADQIASTIERWNALRRGEGRQVWVIPGGGHTPLAAAAYVDATRELAVDCAPSRWRPDWLVHASGTGATQAGLCVGFATLGWSTRVVGISIARRNPRARSVVLDSIRELSNANTMSFALDGQAEDLVEVRDEWVGAGYEQADAHVHDVIARLAREEGLLLDPTYTGKAFLALENMAAAGEIPRGDGVVFWHTGGLLNLLADTRQGSVDR